MSYYKSNKIGGKRIKPSSVTDIEPRPVTRSSVPTIASTRSIELETPRPKPQQVKQYYTKDLKKKEISKIKCTPKLILLAIILSIIGVIVLIGLIFLIIYLATLGTQSKDSFCMSDYNCLTNSSLYCVNAKCSCNINSTWNSTRSICVSNSTNKTILTCPINYPLKMFNGSQYTVTSISAYAGTALVMAYDIGYSPITDYYYIPDNGAGVLVALDSNFNFVKKAFLQDCFYIDVYNTSLYITGYQSGRIYRLDLNMTWLNTFYNTSTSVSYFNIFYNTYANMVYSCDTWTGWLYAYDTSLNRITSESFNTGGCYSSAALSNSTIYISRGGTNVHPYINKAYATGYQICPTGWSRDILIDTCTGTNYMLVGCGGDKMIFLYKVFASSATNLYMNITTAGNPYGMLIDPYGRLIVAMTSPNRIDVYTLV